MQGPEMAFGRRWAFTESSQGHNRPSASVPRTNECSSISWGSVMLQRSSGKDAEGGGCRSALGVS